ncbi:potassium channel family protein [Mesomycoplasma molare]|uniref:Potassium channel family protein n=1 Tax=Mesomycoplasma molare TaxID=171288 RepID=A0ABY5TXZ0_9BACT|nr:potassium channel family protein [Mesomycoplasma molare]UWD34436.1 potassium channel family protein [Mesomycoplasma molare]
MNFKKSFIFNKYFLTILDNIVATREHLKNINENDFKKVKYLKITYFSIIFFFSIFSILSTTILAIFIQSQKNEFLSKFVGVSEIITLFILFIDYFLWMWSQPIRNKKEKRFSRIRFLFSVLSFNLILSILPSLYSFNLLTSENMHVQWITTLKSFKFLRIIRIILLLNIFSSFSSLFSVFKTQKTILTNIFIFIIIIIVLFSLVIWDAELDYIKIHNIPLEDQSSYVNSFSKALYFTTITLTTIGYGDITPHSDIARSLVVIMSIIGIAIFAIPSGVIAGAFLTKVQTKIEKKEQKKKNNTSKE